MKMLDQFVQVLTYDEKKLARVIASQGVDAFTNEPKDIFEEAVIPIQNSKNCIDNHGNKEICIGGLMKSMILVGY